MVVRLVPIINRPIHIIPVTAARPTVVLGNVIRVIWIMGMVCVRRYVMILVVEPLHKHLATPEAHK